MDILLRGDTASLDKSLAKSEVSVKNLAGGAAAGAAGTASALGVIGGAAKGFTGSIDVSATKTVAALRAIGGAAKDAFLGMATALADFSGSATMMMSIVVAATSGIQSALVATSREIGKFAANGIRYLHDLGAAALRLGVTTSALAGLQYGAELAGVSTDDLIGSLVKFSRLLSEAGMGEGGALLALKQLGLEAGKIKDLPLEQQLGKLGDALRDTGNAADKIRLVDAIMGRGGDKLLPFLTQGEAGIQRMIDAAGALGPVSGRSVAEVRAATLAWRQFQGAISGIGQSLAVILAPTLVQIAGYLQGLATAAANFGVANVGLFQEMVRTIAMIAEGVGKLNVATPILRWAWNAFADAIGLSRISAEAFREVVVDTLAAIQFTLENLSGIWSVTWRSMQLAGMDAINGIISAFNAIVGVIGSIAVTLNSVFQDVFEGLVKKFTWLADTLNALSASAIKLKIEPLDTTDLKEKIGALKDELDKAWDKKLKEVYDRVAPKIVPDKQPAKGNPIESVGRKPAAMEMGSKEAFSVLFGTEDYQKKAYNVANDNLKVNKEAQKLLAKIVENLTGVKLAKAKL